MWLQSAQFADRCRRIKLCRIELTAQKNMQKLDVNWKQRMSPAQTERRRRTKFWSIFLFVNRSWLKTPTADPAYDVGSFHAKISASNLSEKLESHFLSKICTWRFQWALIELFSSVESPLRSEPFIQVLVSEHKKWQKRDEIWSKSRFFNFFSITVQSGRVWRFQGAFMSLKMSN